MALSNTTYHILRTLSHARILVGTSTLLLPSHSSWIFGLTPAAIPSADNPINIIGRLFGVRDAVLGAYLWTSLRKFNKLSSTVVSEGKRNRETGETQGLMSKATDQTDTALNTGRHGEEIEQALSTNQLTQALYLGLICDAIDVLSSIVCIFEGSMTGRAIILVGVGAASFACMGYIGLRAVKAL